MAFFFLDRDGTRAITSIVCMILVVHSWLMQRRYTLSRSSLLLWTLVLLLLMLGATWLGLNVIRAHTYDYAINYSRHLGDFRQDLHWYAVETQDRIVWIARADLLPIALLAVVCIWKRKTARLTSNLSAIL